MVPLCCRRCIRHISILLYLSLSHWATICISGQQEALKQHTARPSVLREWLDHSWPACQDLFLSLINARPWIEQRHFNSSRISKVKACSSHTADDVWRRGFILMGRPACYRTQLLWGYNKLRGLQDDNSPLSFSTLFCVSREPFLCFNRWHHFYSPPTPGTSAEMFENWNSRLGVVQPELIDSLTHWHSIYTCGYFPNQHQLGVRHIQIHIKVIADISTVLSVFRNHLLKCRFLSSSLFIWSN